MVDLAIKLIKYLFTLALLHQITHLTLGQLIVMVRELEVNAPGVYVELVAKHVGGHGRALDVPAGPPGAPRRRPRRLARFATLP